MKRLILILSIAMCSITILANIKIPTAVVNGNLSDYKYYHVSSTGGVTSGGGIAYNVFVGWVGDPAKTVVPSDPDLTITF